MKNIKLHFFHLSFDQYRIKYTDYSPLYMKIFDLKLFQCTQKKITKHESTVDIFRPYHMGVSCECNPLSSPISSDTSILYIKKIQQLRLQFLLFQSFNFKIFKLFIHFSFIFINITFEEYYFITIISNTV